MRDLLRKPKGNISKWQLFCISLIIHEKYTFGYYIYNEIKNKYAPGLHGIRILHNADNPDHPGLEYGHCQD